MEYVIYHEEMDGPVEILGIIPSFIEAMILEKKIQRLAKLEQEVYDYETLHDMNYYRSMVRKELYGYEDLLAYFEYEDGDETTYLGFDFITIMEADNIQNSLRRGDLL